MKHAGDGRARGLSLVEVIFSLALLGAVTILVMNLFPTSMVTVKKAEYRMQANLLAETLLAEQAARPFDQLEVGAPALTRTERVEAVDYQTSVQVLAVDGRDPNLIKSLRATVTWRIQTLQHSLVRELWVANVKK